MGFHAGIATPAPKYGSHALRGIPAHVMHSKGAGCTQQRQDFVPVHGTATFIRSVSVVVKCLDQVLISLKINNWGLT